LRGRRRYFNDGARQTLTNRISGVAPATFQLVANAADSDGTISKVAFYSGSTLLSTDTSAPYTATFASATPGTYKKGTCLIN
jgi:hypothetical protein